MLLHESRRPAAWLTCDVRQKSSMDINLALGVGAFLFAALVVWLVARSEPLLVQSAKIRAARVVQGGRVWLIEKHHLRAGMVFIGCLLTVHLFAFFLVCPWPFLAKWSSTSGRWINFLTGRDVLLISAVEWGIDLQNAERWMLTPEYKAQRELAERFLKLVPSLVKKIEKHYL